MADKKYKLGEVLITREQIAARVAEMGKEIAKDYEGKEIRLKIMAEDSNNNTYEIDDQILSSSWIATANFEDISQDDVPEGFFATVWRWLTNALNEVKDLIESLLNKVLVALADGIFSVICMAVGEEVTIDRVIFGRVKKLSINFWDGTQATRRSHKSKQY